MVFVATTCDQRQSTAHHEIICHRRCCCRRRRQRKQVLLELWNFKLKKVILLQIRIILYERKKIIFYI